MGKRINRSLEWLAAFGFEPFKTRAALKNLPKTFSDFRSLKRQNATEAVSWPISLSKPCFHDRTDQGGTAKGHYFHQDLLVARRIFDRKPVKHVDVGSRVDGFVAHVAVFREIEVFDVRPISSEVKNISFKQADLMDSANGMADYCDSLSCLHALEHFGLGRYGDPLDIAGHEKGFAALTRMLRPGGILYLSLPIGSDRIEFNGERVMSIATLQKLYARDFDLEAFSYVDDAGDLHENVGDVNERAKDNFNLKYGCGIFELIKK